MPQWDRAVYSQDGQLVLAVEVKAILGTSPTWAAQLRRNILAHGIYPNAPFFLMVFPDRFYLWEEVEPSLEPVEPTAVIDAGPILQPYFDNAGISADEISGASLEFIVTTWLNDMIHTPPDRLDSSDRWLVDSGLFEAIAGGSLSEVFA